MADNLANSVSIPQVKRIPGYGGFCPSVRQNYGVTYGNATNSFYLKSRNQKLNTSRKYNTKFVGQAFFQPDVDAARNGNRWKAPFPYTLNMSGPRRENVLQFDKFAQVHREHYKDHSGLVLPVEKIRRRTYSAPPIGKIPQLVVPDVHSKSVSFIRRTSLTAMSPLLQRRGSAKERATRDSFFEKR